MRNITISIDDDILEQGRQYAQQHGMSLNALIRELLTRTVAPGAGPTLQELFQLMDRAKGDSRGQRWTRDELYDA